ncbi:hypothetical protein ATO5_02655 [Loktanella sp. 22II-4b]|nr:hypothetical protein ATO5_02655 [Loktanella sp. 22II-4b]
MDREWAEKVDDLHEFVSLVGLTALRALVQKSPVDTGRFKGNWQLSIGTPEAGQLETTDPSGGATLAKGSTAIAPYAGLKNFPPVWIVNNLPYSERLEDGYSKQAPGGMVGLTVAELQTMFNGEDV